MVGRPCPDNLRSDGRKRVRIISPPGGALLRRAVARRPAAGRRRMGPRPAVARRAGLVAPYVRSRSPARGGSGSRRTASLLGEETPGREVTAAALLHDVGKVESSFGTFSRVGITLAALASGRTRLVAWAEDPDSGGERSGRRPGLRTRVGLYLTHDRIGADLLRAAGANQLTVTWAGRHHQPPETWTVDRRVAQALKDRGRGLSGPAVRPAVSSAAGPAVGLRRRRGWVPWMNG